MFVLVTLDYNWHRDWHMLDGFGGNGGRGRRGSSLLISHVTHVAEVLVHGSVVINLFNNLHWVLLNRLGELMQMVVVSDRNLWDFLPLGFLLEAVGSSALNMVA